MTQQDILQAAAARLRELWPQRAVYAGAIPTGAQSGFWLWVEERACTRGLDRQRDRQLRLGVRYYAQDGDDLTWSAWLETMFAAFRRLACRGREVHVRQAQGGKGQAEGYCDFTCLIRLVDWADEDEGGDTGGLMDSLEQQVYQTTDGKDG